jgi:antirestriction protein ArdC
MSNTEEKQDVYTRITSKIITSLGQGVRPWMKPWNAEHAAGKITRPLRHNGQPYSGINILMLWASAMEQGFAAPIWMTFKQALDLNAHVRKSEKGSLVVYANSITRTEHDDSGEDIEREIPFLKDYTVFNVEQIDGLPEIYYAKAESQLTPVERIARAEEFFKHISVTFEARRQPRLLPAGAGLRADADHRSLRRRRKLLRHARTCITFIRLSIRSA